jgi:hypothetical protein
MYKATQTIDGTATSQSESATTATSTISRLTQVNDGETVTQLDGTNYLGWIHADQTAYYKVISTPLHWIEKDGEVDKTYTVALSAYYTGGGFCNVLKDCPVVAVSTMITRDIIATFIENDLGGKLGDDYAQPQGRITIVND